MDATHCLILPFMRGPLPDGADGASTAPHWSGALRLWPGLPQQEGLAPKGYFCPTDYPFTPPQAAACLEDLRHLDATALSGLTLEATVSSNAQTGKLMRELAGLDDFSALSGSEAAARAIQNKQVRLEREQAQKALLWLWLQEERLSELAQLTVRYAQNARALSAVLEEGDDAAQALSLPGIGLELSSGLDPALIPPWRLAMVNAACFLPEDMAILAEGQMREDLLERLPFASAPEHAPLLGCPMEEAGYIVAARAPLWQALGQRSRPASTSPLTVQMCTERLWLTWRDRS